MNRTHTLIAGLAVCALMAGCAQQAAAPAAPTDAKGRPLIGDAERALAMWQVQGVMSKHEYYHAAGLNSEEIDALWVSPTGEYAKTATFASPAWVMNGLDTVKRAYGEQNQQNRVKALEALSKVDPSVKNVPENLGAGHEWAMHTSTTPVIEVAGDGKTAKGIWYSPGMGLMTSIVDGKPQVRGTFFWEKYGGDFVKEDGQWKIWHMQMAYDFTPQLDGKWLEFGKPKGMKEAGERMQQEMPPGFSKPKYSYPSFSPQRSSIIYPPIPEPYYTFGETFSY
ncbi:MAG: nuclear transport factor 2 family protein [Steroidobacteraceae bacterium]